jgi:hypothetical protein
MTEEQMGKKSIEERIQRIEDVREIENLMAKYAYLHTAGRHEDTAELFAKKTPGVRVNLMGVYEGTDGVRRAMVKTHQSMNIGKPGFLFVHAQTTPVIEVAGDGKTAKGVWMSPGLETRKNQRTGEFVAYWLWGNYAVDFVKEDGKWRFWHFHVYPYMVTSYDKSWTEPLATPLTLLPDETKPDRPPTYNSIYTTTAEIRYDPVPPEPYETFDEKSAY